ARRVGVRLRGCCPDRAGADVGRAERLSRPRLLDPRRRGSEQQTRCDRALGSWVVPAEVDAVGSEPERSLDVVVDHEGRLEDTEAAAGLDQLVGGATVAA